MLKNLDQSVDLLCNFYNLDLQLDERMEAIFSGQPGSDLSPDQTYTFRDLFETGQKRFVSRRDRDRIKRFMNKNLDWGAVDTCETWLTEISKTPPHHHGLGKDHWFASQHVLELLQDYYTVRCFIQDILQSRIGEDVLSRIGGIFSQIGTFETRHWELMPKKQYYGRHWDKSRPNTWLAANYIVGTNEERDDLKKVSNKEGYWELSDVKWEVNNFRLMVVHFLYGVPMGFVMKKALADSIQAIINGDRSVVKCILCDRIFRVPKVRGDRKKYCGSGCRSKASKEKNREDNDL